ncbi:MAG TPA: hypothetical protein VM889_12400 [Candidatus Thermoplasmatota archaeon]|nr:hypothetical protein [Candidatus Thermoplasmatota archaeon]
MAAVRALPVLLLVLPALAGCLGATSEGPVDVPPFRAGDAATYVVTGTYLEAARLWNAVPLPTGSATLAFETRAAEPILDGALARRAVMEVETRLGTAKPHLRWVDSDGVVASFLPLSEEGHNALSFEERGFPWAFGASVLAGRALAPGDRFPFTLQNLGGQAAPLALAWRVERVEAGRATVALDHDRHGFSATLVLDAASAFPLEARWNVTAESDLGRFLRLSPGDHAMTAARTSASTGSGPAPPTAPAAAARADAIVFAPHHRVHPPDGAPPAVAFALADAVAAARSHDGARAWLASRPDAIVARATYHAPARPEGAPTAIPGMATHAWLVQFVGRDEAFFEAMVERVVANATGAAVATRVTKAGPVEPPRGGQGWIDPASWPAEMTTIASAVAVVREGFAPAGVEIFVRSFARPGQTGYFYLIDGGFEKPLGRYTVTVDARTGYVMSAVGPVRPLAG